MNRRRFLSLLGLAPAAPLIDLASADASVQTVTDQPTSSVGYMRNGVWEPTQLHATTGYLQTDMKPANITWYVSHGLDGKGPNTYFTSDGTYTAATWK